MRTEGRGLLLRVFVGAADTVGGKPLYEEIVRRAREVGIVGATVVRGIEGYGAHGQVHASRILRISENLPVVVEIVDTPERVEAFLPVLDELLEEGLVAIEPVRTITYRKGEA